LWRKSSAAGAKTAGDSSRPLPFIQRLARTFVGYTEGILARWKHRISSGTMEGINHKIKTIQHQTHGLRDERFFMLRLYALHQAHYKFIG
jgi:transposase